ncbi:MAG TPA: pitrilysin family protein [bacterium]|nr:pitrilysin family protein [bacterium]
MDSLEHIRKTVLPNGITVVTEYVDFVRSVAIGVWVEVGSRDENPENNGIAHFMEHMVFKGTENRTPFEIANTIESLGGNINAFTGKELTCFYARVLDEHLPQAISVLSDILLHPLFLPDDIEKEKSVVREELADVEDTPSDLIHEYFIAQMYPAHPLGYSILGNRHSIQNFSRELIKEFTGRFYLPERIVVSVAGHVDHDHLLELVNQYLGGFSPAVSNPRTLVPPQGAATGIREYRDGMQQAHLISGVRTFSYSDPRRYALLVLNTILSGGMSSRLFQNIREKYGFVYSIYSFVDFFTDNGVFGVYIGTEKSQVDFMQEQITEELRQMSDALVSDGEVQKVKSQVKGSLVLSLENMFSRMNRLAKQDIYYKEFQTIDQYIAQVEEVTADDIRNLAGELFQEEQMVTSILRPVDS